ncbi:MAG: CinA family protein [Gammaproteobacteria bacterium]|nr:MAG: CinA family protein [Gammaproteobacteria bacterium]
MDLWGGFVEDFESDVAGLLVQLAEKLTARGWRMATAESCTGGWIAKCCTDLAGSSAWFDRGHIVYSYRAKEDLLGIAHADLLKYGAVSEEIACQMAVGARERSGVAVTVAATGIAGPGGGMEGKPVGLVHFSWCIDGRAASCDAKVFSGDRNEIRQKTVLHALEGILIRLDAIA